MEGSLAKAPTTDYTSDSRIDDHLISGWMEEKRCRTGIPKTRLKSYNARIEAHLKVETLRADFLKVSFVF